MNDNIVDSSEYGIYIVDRRMKSVEESIQQLSDQMLMFCNKTRRQRINQRNRTERLSDLLDWKRMGLEYIKARQLALRRAYPDSFDDDYFGAIDESAEGGQPRAKIPNPRSAPGSPRIRTPLEGSDNELTFANMSISDREKYLSYKMQGHDDDDDLQIRIPFRRQSTQEAAFSEGHFTPSNEEVIAAKENIASVGVAAAQAQYKDKMNGTNGFYSSATATSSGSSAFNGKGYQQ